MSSKTLIQGQTTARDDGAFHVQVEVPADLIYFRGHYEGAPVMAAAVQLDVMLLPQIERLWPALGPFQRAARLKFKRPIGPGDRLTLVLRLEGRKVDCKALRGGEVCTQGALHFRDGPAS